MKGIYIVSKTLIKHQGLVSELITRGRHSLLSLPAGHNVDQTLDWLSLLDLKLSFLLLDQVEMSHELMFQFLHVCHFAFDILSQFAFQHGSLKVSVMLQNKQNQQNIRCDTHESTNMQRLMNSMKLVILLHFI